MTKGKINPYCAGAGTRPPLLVGRARQMAEVEHFANQFEARRGAENIVWSGLRGMGKTVLLREVLDMFVDRGWFVGYHEVRRDAGLGGSVASIIMQGTKTLGRGKLHRALGWLRELVGEGVLSADVGDITFRLGLRPTRPGPPPEDVLDALFLRLGEAAADAGVGAVFLFDELQLMARGDLSALLHASEAAKDVPVGFLGAGLPDLPPALSAAGTYAERLFYDRIDWLGDTDVAEAIQVPADEFGVHYSREAMALLIERSAAYPYFLQLYAEETWKAAGTPSDRRGYVISPGDVLAAVDAVRRRLDDGLYRLRLDKASPSEQEYLRAMASLGDGQVSSGDVTRLLGKSHQQASTQRDRLITKGIIYAPAHAVVQFSVPGFGDYLRRYFDTGRLVIPSSGPRLPTRPYAS
jgi:hypothetical protein